MLDTANYTSCHWLVRAERKAFYFLLLYEMGSSSGKVKKEPQMDLCMQEYFWARERSINELEVGLRDFSL